MIFEIIFYFFIVFGILQFSVCIWEFFTSTPPTEDAFIILKPTENTSDVIRSLKKYPLKIYAVTDNINANHCEANNIEYLTKEDIMQKF